MMQKREERKMMSKMMFTRKRERYGKEECEREERGKMSKTEEEKIEERNKRENRE